MSLKLEFLLGKGLLSSGTVVLNKVGLFSLFFNRSILQQL